MRKGQLGSSGISNNNNRPDSEVDADLINIGWSVEQSSVGAESSIVASAARTVMVEGRER